MKAIYDNKSCVKIKEEQSECFEERVWYNVNEDGVLKELETKIHEEGAQLKMEDKVWKVPIRLYSDYTAF